MNNRQFNERFREELRRDHSFAASPLLAQFQWSAKQSIFGRKVIATGRADDCEMRIVIKPGAQGEGKITEFGLGKSTNWGLIGAIIALAAVKPATALISVAATKDDMEPYGFSKLATTKYDKMNMDERNMVEAVRNAGQRAMTQKPQPGVAG